MKINNPYSQNRYTFKERMERKFTELVIPLIRYIPMSDKIHFDSKPKYIPGSIFRIRRHMKYRENHKIWDNSKPSYMDIDLLSVYVSEYIPIENIDNLEKGLLKIFKEHKPVSYAYNDPSQIKTFCNEVRQSIYGGRWSTFGHIAIDKDSELYNYVKHIEIHATQISSSSIILGFNISPSEPYLNIYKSEMRRNIEEETTLHPSVKKFFTFWGSRTIPGDAAKEKKIEDLLLELKWRTLKEMGKYLEMYFISNKIIFPSIEVYKIQQDFSEIKLKKNESQFLSSIGLRESYYHDKSKDGYWDIYGGDTTDKIDSSVKITCNSHLPGEPYYSTHDFQIEDSVREFADNLLPILVMRNYTMNLSENIAIQQKEIFSSIKKSKPNYKKLINIRYDLETNLQLLKRFKSEISDDVYKQFKYIIKNSIGEFEPVNRNSKDKVWSEIIVENTKFMIEKTFTHSQNLSKIIDDTVKLLEIKTNNSLRKKTFSLTIFTVILSLIATAFAGLSLYYSLDKEEQNKVVGVLDYLKTAWTYFFS